MFRTRMEAVSAAVMLRRIAVLGERGHDHIPFYPVPVFPRGSMGVESRKWHKTHI